MERARWRLISLCLLPLQCKKHADGLRKAGKALFLRLSLAIGSGSSRQVAQNPPPQGPRDEGWRLIVSYALIILIPLPVKEGDSSSTSKQSSIASRARCSKTSSDLAWVWHPRNSGTLATKYPSRSFSITRLKVRALDFMVSVCYDSCSGSCSGTPRPASAVGSTGLDEPLEKAAIFLILEPCALFESQHEFSASKRDGDTVDFLDLNAARASS